jgi:hypothetical protein
MGKIIRSASRSVFSPASKAKLGIASEKRGSTIVRCNLLSSKTLCSKRVSKRQIGKRARAKTGISLSPTRKFCWDRI